MYEIARKLPHAAFKNQNQSTPKQRAYFREEQGSTTFFKVLPSSETRGRERKAVRGRFLTWLHYPRLGTQIRQVHVGFPAIDDGVGVFTSPFSSSSVSHGDLNRAMLRIRTLSAAKKKPLAHGSHPAAPPTPAGAAGAQPGQRGAPARRAEPSRAERPGGRAEERGAGHRGPLAGAGRRARAGLRRRQIIPGTAVSGSNRRAAGAARN